ncbi:amino acid transporter, putative [Rhizoctonia solani AG-1 IA]|uniref:Amino acid transporter, putative n=1 Tax=Thanatephorus cucumeris (strain AG1-IA) TaxID=983506 RepID=L8WZ54_THACA|nr:amino acid transporter, putative [Rhizoctonia solani AG-1 IA]
MAYRLGFQLSCIRRICPSYNQVCRPRCICLFVNAAKLHSNITLVLGAVTGWNFWYSMAITAVVELVATCILGRTGFRHEPYDINLLHVERHIVVTVFWIPMVLINLGPVRVYGEITLIVVLLLVGLVITAGGGPTHESIGFRSWPIQAGELYPHPLSKYWKLKWLSKLALSEGQTIGGSWGKFLAVWSTLINAAFAYGNIQVVAIAGCETKNPRVAIPKAVNKTFSRVVLFYISSVFMIGLLLPSTEPLLLGGDGTAAQSPFVIAMHRARIRVLPDIVNAVVLSSAFIRIQGVSCIFIASRSLIGLAEDGNAPVIFSRTNRLGNPWVAVMCSSAFGALGYLSVTEKSMKVLLWLINLSAVAGLVSWIILCIGYLRFYAAIKAQGYTRDGKLSPLHEVRLPTLIFGVDLPYRAPFQPFTAWFALVMVILITFFSGK